MLKYAAIAFCFCVSPAFADDAALQKQITEQKDQIARLTSANEGLTIQRDSVEKMLNDLIVQQYVTQHVSKEK